MKNIAVAAAALGGILLTGALFDGVASAAGPVGITTLADQSLVHQARRGGGGFRGRSFHRGFRGGGFHRGGFRGGSFHRGGGIYRGGGYRGRAYRGRGVVRRGYGRNLTYGRRYYGGIYYGHGRRFWRGRWWAYGVGSCWRLTPDGFYVWVCY